MELFTDKEHLLWRSKQGFLVLRQRKWFDNYYQNYPKLKEFIANQIQKARQNGFVETILGRRRYLKDINSNNFVVRGHSERNAVKYTYTRKCGGYHQKRQWLILIKSYRKVIYKQKCFFKFIDELFIWSSWKRSRIGE